MIQLNDDIAESYRSNWYLDGDTMLIESQEFTVISHTKYELKLLFVDVLGKGRLELIGLDETKIEYAHFRQVLTFN